MKKFEVLLAVILMAAPTLSQAATAAANSVNTAAIQNLAVTGPKIAAGAVGATNIAAGAVGSAAIAAGAVTDAKISGTISASKLPVGTSSSTVAAGNHTHDASYQKKYAGVVVVAKTGGDYNNPVTALAGITTASASNPILVKVMPGIYDIGSASVVMKPYVELEGSGDSSVISSSAAGYDDWSCDAGTVNMANNSAIRDIKIVNTGVTVDGQRLASSVVMNNVSASAENITVVSGSDIVFNARNAGICTQGPQGFARINNVRAETKNYGDGHSNATMVMDDASMTVTNSNLLSSVSGPGNGWTHVLDCVDGHGGSAVGVATVVNSQLESRINAPNTGGHSAFWVSFCAKSSISNSVLIANTATDEIINAENDLTVVNTQMFTANQPGVPSINWRAVGTARFINSRISGGINDLTNVKMCNNYDENANPIPNR